MPYTKFLDENGRARSVSSEQRLPVFNAPQYIGLSSDTKPTTNVITGARFLEKDTLREFMWDGSQWNLIIPGVTMLTALDKDSDSIDVAKMSKSGMITAHNAIAATATSVSINAKGFNTVFVRIVITGTGTWKIDVVGSPDSGGTYVDCYDGATQLTTGNLTASRGVLFRGIPDYIKIVATEVADGATCTVDLQFMNL